MTTFAALVAAIDTMTVTGVTRKFTAPPTGVSTADLPASFPMLPSGPDAVLTFGNTGKVGSSQPTITCDLVYLVEPVGQGTGPQNYAACVTLLDNIVSASRALTRPTAGPLTFTLRMAIVPVGQTDYWSIVQTWTGVG